MCVEKNWYLGDIVDQCAPAKPYPVPGQQVYIKDEQNFCINLPNPDSIFLQNNFYNLGKYPTIVQAEGFVQSFCMGSYLPPGAKPLPWGGIRSAQVIKNFTKSLDDGYLQVAGTLDCDLLKINCSMSAPGLYDDGGQYDNVGFINCGKEPYSGVDTSPNANPLGRDYVEMAGDGQFCMRVCGPNSNLGCDARHDTEGCYKFMGVVVQDGFSYTDAQTGVKTVATVSLPPLKTTAAATAAATNTGAATGGAVTTKSDATFAAVSVVGLTVAALLL
ncbi:hypothetical protein HDU79_006577 [Rhizoclosmatium sp. JEL0117]|nr:hypothetical protein HDU79_006577 [Rhizoclosmatium sp. JEL0117]